MKNQFRITNYFLLIFIISAVFFSFTNPGNNKSQKSIKNYFKFADNITQNDYTPNIIIFKLKEESRNTAKVNEIDNAVINIAFRDLNVSSVRKIFPNDDC